MKRKIQPKKKFKSIFFFIIACFTIACDNEYRLDSRDRTIIDTTANKEILRLATVMEDSCKKHFEQKVQKITDSLVQYQLIEIEKKLNMSVKNK